MTIPDDNTNHNDNTFVIIEPDDDLTIDNKKVLEEKQSFLEEARSQDIMSSE